MTDLSKSITSVTFSFLCFFLLSCDSGSDPDSSETSSTTTGSSSSGNSETTLTSSSTTGSSSSSDNGSVLTSVWYLNGTDGGYYKLVAGADNDILEFAKTDFDEGWAPNGVMTISFQGNLVYFSNSRKAFLKVVAGADNDEVLFSSEDIDHHEGYHPGFLIHNGSLCYRGKISGMSMEEEDPTIYKVMAGKDNDVVLFTKDDFDHPVSTDYVLDVGGKIEYLAKDDLKFYELVAGANNDVAIGGYSDCDISNTYWFFSFGNAIGYVGENSGKTVMKLIMGGTTNDIPVFSPTDIDGSANYSDFIAM